MELAHQEPDQFRVQIVVQLIHHDYVPSGQRVDPRRRQCEHLPRAVGLLGYVNFGCLSAVGSMPQEDIHFRAVGVSLDPGLPGCG